MEQGCPVSGCWMLLLLFRDPFLLADVRWPVSCSVPGPVPSLFWSDSCLLQLSSQVCWVGGVLQYMQLWGGGRSSSSRSPHSLTLFPHRIYIGRRLTPSTSTF